MAVRSLGPEERTGAVAGLAEVLADCVAGGASVGFLLPFTFPDAAAYWQVAAPAMDILLVAETGGRIAGTVSLRFAAFPNGRHRAEVVKLLVHRRARGRGIARRLMAAAEAEALAAGRTTLHLDTLTGSDAESLYQALGWQAAGIIPDYCLVGGGNVGSTTVMYRLLRGEP